MWKEVLWDPLPDSRLEHDAPYPSQRIKLYIWAMFIVSVVITGVVVARFIIEGRREFSVVAFVCILAMLWFVFFMLSLLFLLSHPHYLTKIRDLTQCRRCRGHRNPLHIFEGEAADYVETITLDD
jgi:membrane-anchored glycerophosphoryl diester phosphodiesterase (GDPDase)